MTLMQDWIPSGKQTEMDNVQLRCIKDTEKQDSERDIIEPNEKLSFPSLLKIGFIKLVKLNMTSITTFAFHMVHCEEINGQLHMYLYGDQTC